MAVNIKFDELDKFLKPKWGRAGAQRLHQELSEKYHYMLGQYDVEAPGNFKYYREVLCDALSMLALSRRGSVSAKEIEVLELPVSELTQPRVVQLGYERVVGDARSAYGEHLKEWAHILSESAFHTNIQTVENDEDHRRPQGGASNKDADNSEEVVVHHESSFHNVNVYPSNESDAIVILALSDSVPGDSITDAQRAKMLGEVADALFSLHFTGMRIECVDGSIKHTSECTLGDLWYCALESANKRQISICAVCGHPAISQPRGKPRKYCEECRKWISNEKKAKTGRTRRERLF